MIKIAVLISDKGKGTNLQAIIDEIKLGKINGEIVVVVSDTKNAIGLSRAKKNNLQIAICRLFFLALERPVAFFVSLTTTTISPLIFPNFIASIIACRFVAFPLSEMSTAIFIIKKSGF